MILKQIYKPECDGLFYRWYLLSRNMFMLLSFCFALLILNACGALPSLEDSEYVKGESQMNFEYSDQDIVLPPPGNNDNAAQADQTNIQMMSNGLPALQALKGVKVDQLFSQNIRDADQRFDRLERTVLDLRREFEAIKPAIIRLVAVEADIEQLVDTLEEALENEPPGAHFDGGNAVPPTAAASPFPPPGAPIPLAPAQATPPPVVVPHHSQTSDGSIKRVRAGQHKDFTRLVIDLRHETPYRIDLDNQEKLMLIELPKAKIFSPMNKPWRKFPLLEAYSVQPGQGGEGGQVIIQLKRPVTILQDKMIPPGSNPDARIFIDLSG